MAYEDYLEGIVSKTVETARVRTHYLTTERNDGDVLVCVHGNLSSAIYWEETLLELGKDRRVIAPDLRGFGETEAGGIDGTRGVCDFADDLDALFDALGLEKVDLMGWSIGGAVIMQYAMDHPERVGSLTLVAPMSPYGFGGTKGVDGEPCWPDHAGTGGGTANPEMVEYLKQGERADLGPTSPRGIMHAFYFKPPFKPAPAREEAFLTSMLSVRVEDAHYPGDMTPSENWPNVAPGTTGMNNAISGKFLDLSGFADGSTGFPVLWVRGADDLIVSDASLFDFGTLGQLGAVPGWPGEDAFPPQPMLSQLRSVLDAWADRGGEYEEFVLEDCGHSPHIEKADAFNDRVRAFLTR